MKPTRYLSSVCAACSHPYNYHCHEHDNDSCTRDGCACIAFVDAPNAYTPPMIAAKVASGVAADAIAADDATRETASTRVLPRTDEHDEARHNVEVAVLRAGIRTLREALEEVVDGRECESMGYRRYCVTHSKALPCPVGEAAKALFATRGLAMTDPLAPEHTTGDACVASADAEEK